MQRLSLLAAGAAAMKGVTIIDDQYVTMGLEYYVDGDYLHFVANQVVKIDQEIQMAS